MINIKAIQIANGFIYQHTYQNLVFLNEVCAKLLQSCPTLRDSVDCSPPGSSVHRILQVRTLEWVAVPSSREYPRPRDRTHVCYVSCPGRRLLYHWNHLGSPIKHSNLFSKITSSEQLKKLSLKQRWFIHTHLYFEFA